MLKALRNTLGLMAVILIAACSDDVGEDSVSSYTIVVQDSGKFEEFDECHSLKKSDEILKLVGATQGKIAFRDEVSGSLIYTELSSSESEDLKFYKMTDSLDVYHPEISPDGQWVAFCTTFEGTDFASNLYVQNLKTGKIVMLKALNATVPRWRVIGSDTIITYIDFAGLNQFDDWKEYSTWFVRFSNGEFSAPEFLFKPAYTNLSSDFSFAVTGGANLYHRVKGDGSSKSYKDSLWYNGDQVCNVSLSQDGTYRTSFLDLTGSAGVEFVGESYIGHRKLIVVDSTGTVVQAVEAPEGFSFNDTEWLANANFEICTLEDSKNENRHTRIALINMETETVDEFVEGKDMYHVSFWMKK